MIEIVLILLIWASKFFPLWVNIIATILLFIRFTFRSAITIAKFMERD